MTIPLLSLSLSSQKKKNGTDPDKAKTPDCALIISKCPEGFVFICSQGVASFSCSVVRW
jgi:hypothetical protein